MTSYDNYFTYLDKPFAENLNDCLLLSNVFDMTVPISMPQMFSDKAWKNTTNSRKCSVAIVTLKELLSDNISIDIVNNQSVLTGSGTVMIGFYPNFNSFGKIRSIDWQNDGNVNINLKTIDNNYIVENITPGDIEEDYSHLSSLEEIIIEIEMDNATLYSIDVVMENKQEERYGAEVSISNVDGLDTRLESLENTLQNIANIIYPIGAIYITTNNVNPATLFGGTWQQIKGRFLLGAGAESENSTNYIAGATGGHKDAVVVSHNHTQSSHNHTQSAHTHTVSHRHRQYGKWSDGSGSGSGYMYSAKRHVVDLYTDYSTPTTSSAQPNISSVAPTIQSKGVSGVDMNMPPYLVVYVWQRTE